MSRYSPRPRPGWWLSAVLALWAVAAFAVSQPSARASRRDATASQQSTTPQQQEQQQQKQQPSATPSAGEFAGEDTCLTCHDDKRGYHDSPHGIAANPRSPRAGQGCESCHGPGKAHADAGGDPNLIQNPPKMQPREASDTCLTCHTRGAHVAWEGSAHDVRQLSCTTCHSVHAFKSERAQLQTADETELCARCHRDKIAKMDRSGHMPLREGKMECSSCHNPHGSSTNVRLLRAGNSIPESCVSCHTDKRGPYLYEHAPVRENCATCHDPHGSSNERMLVAKQPLLCQRCHIHTRHPATIYDNLVVNTSNRLYARSCATCHSQVHGSNHPSGGTFLR
ncbi:MAG TPA: DmsE family decaheme c-type cytochrome [Vicinamibacterales bacterium]|nr:DmsE family decaheme c-type cytochrome [Vicinamibacterales bacterium]